MQQEYPHAYFLQEEIANSITHAIGSLLGIVALVLLIVHSSSYGSARTIVACTIFGVGLVIAYTSSAIYHAIRVPKLKKIFKQIDHISIYILIAASYTPVSLVSLQGGWGWSLFGVIWGIAILGTIYKLFYIDGPEWISTLIYVAMGWLAVIAVVPLVECLTLSCLLWLFFGGLSYTLGVIFFMWESKPFAHTIWHCFVLGGSICHFFAILFYVAPISL